jgi:hypothetical protein
MISTISNSVYRSRSKSSPTCWQHPWCSQPSLYGDWRTPDPHFDTVVAARNLAALTPFLHSLGMIKIADALLSWQPKKVKAGVRHLHDHGFHSALLSQINDLIL